MSYENLEDPIVKAEEEMVAKMKADHVQFWSKALKDLIALENEARAVFAKRRKVGGK